MEQTQERFFASLRMTTCGQELLRQPNMRRTPRKGTSRLRPGFEIICRCGNLGFNSGQAGGVFSLAVDCGAGGFPRDDRDGVFPAGAVVEQRDLSSVEQRG